MSLLDDYPHTKLYRYNCPECSVDYPTAIVSHFGVTMEGTLILMAVCRRCLVAMNLTHTWDEITADMREMFNVWKQENPGGMDFKEWEQEFPSVGNGEGDE